MLPIGLSESKLDSSVWNSQENIEDYVLIRMDCSRRGGGFACYIIKLLSYNHKSSNYFVFSYNHQSNI